MAAGSPLIDLQGVARAYDGEDGELVDALADVTLRVAQGEFVCLAGPSGSGKSTLLNIIGCLDRPTAGVYRFAGADTGDLDADGRAVLRRDAIGFVFQGVHLLDAETARTNVALPATYQGLGADAARRRADELLRELGLGDKADARAGDLSGGERQRVAIARALMNGARVILADEPTSALDSAHSDEVLDALAALPKRGHTVVVASHDAAVRARAERTVELQGGRVMADSFMRGASPSRTPAEGSFMRGAGPSRTPAEGSFMRGAGPSRTPAEGSFMRGASPSGTSGQLTSAPPATARSSARRVAQAAREGVRALLRRPLASGLATLSVALGACCVIATLGLTVGAYDGSTAVMGRMGADEIWAFGSFPGPSIRVTPEDAQAIGALATVRRAEISAHWNVTLRRADKQLEKQVYGVGGVFPHRFMWMDYTVASGAPLRPEDEALRSRVVVISTPVRDALFGAGAAAVGETLLINDHVFTVKGVHAPHPIFSQAMYRERGQVDYSVSAPFSALRDALGDHDVKDQWLNIQAQATDPSQVQAAAAAIRDLLIRRHGLADPEKLQVAYDDPITGSYWARVHNRIALVGALAAVAFLAGGCVTTVVMLAAVRGRRGEIALRMALGARRRDVAWQFVTESSLMAVVGGLVGAALGLATVWAVGTWADFRQITYEAWFVPAAVGCAVAVGLAAGIAPARRASQLDPAAVLAEE